MGSEDVSRQTQSRADEAGVTAELRQLAARVDQLERELAAMRSERGAHAPLISAPPPPPPPLPQAAIPWQEPIKADAAPNLPPVAVAVPPSLGQPKPASPSLENRLGAQVFNRIGIVALLFAATLGLKLAIDNQWIGPVGRIVIGLLAGAGLIVWSERFRRKGFAVFSYSLKAVGTGVLYLSLWAAFQIYHLLPSSAALLGMILVTAWNAYMAWSQNAELLAAYALAGGLSTPLLLSTGGNHEIFLFTYLLAIDAATALLVRVRQWNRLLFAAFPATVIYFVGWYWKFFAEPEFAVTTLFVGLFFLVFVSVSVGRREEGVGETATRLGRFGHHTRDILLPLGNAAFASLALYSVMQDSERHWFLPWLMLILAAAYLLITRLPQAAAPAAVHLSLAVVFLTIAVPLKASGHWITVAWLVEGVALLWASARIVDSQDQAQRNSSAVLRWLSAGSFVLGLCALLATPYWFGEGVALPFFNHNFATALIGAAAFAGAAWLSLRATQSAEAPKPEYLRFAVAAVVAVAAIAVLLALREVATSAWISLTHTAFANADFGMAIVAIAILAAVMWWSRRLALRDDASLLWAQLAAGALIVINLIAILTGVREIRSLWPVVAPGSDGELQRSLAVSGYLMLYGAVLLGIGFWRRSAFIRWQALVLLVFSIFKTFLYDMRNLSQGYRFISFLALGALLMTISFAYQKDWLALRETGAPAQDEGQRGSLP
jgi:uncharacterized membrane protein